MEKTDRPPSPLASPAKLKSVLGVRAMIGLIFFEVCGGPYGAEPVVREAGPLLAFLGFLLIPLIWSVPIAVMTAELCSDDPHVGGKIYFVHREWGPRVGWYNGWVNAVSNVFDVATLPVMALSYAEDFLGPLSAETHWWSAFALVALAVGLNIIGVEVVGNISYLLCIAVCMPPFFLVVMGLPELRLPAAPVWVDVDWRKFLTLLMWNTSGFDDAGATAAEVRDATKVYPAALTWSIVLVTATYVAPLVVGTSVVPDATKWHSGFLSHVAGVIGGSTLAWSVSGAGFASSVAQLNALLCSSVREIVCMAEQPGQPVPSALGRLHPKFGTPYFGTVAFGLLLMLVLQYKFTELVAATVLFDCMSFLIQFATWLRFRWRVRNTPASPDVFRTSLGFTTVAVWVTAPATLCVLVIVLTLLAPGRGMQGAGAMLVTLISGEVLYRVPQVFGWSRGGVLDETLLGS